MTDPFQLISDNFYFYIVITLMDQYRHLIRLINHQRFDMSAFIY